VKRGFILNMWTGLFPEGRDGCPQVFRTKRAALAHAARCPSWGRSAVSVYRCTVRPGSNGKPDYILGDVVANGCEA
jgi:hypothetical protein